MTEYEKLVDMLVDMSKITRPPTNQTLTREQRIQHGICDMLEDAAITIDELIKKVREHEGRKIREVV